MRQAGVIALFALSVIGCGSDEGGSLPPGITPTDGGSDAPAATSPCVVTSKGTAGVMLTGTLLLPTGEPSPGSVLVDAAGKIACVGACTAGEATVLTCDGAVIAPGLINAHDHTDYNVGGPYVHGTTRWTWRQGWRTGALGEKELPTMPRVKNDTESAIAELRFVLGGVTSIVGSGGVDGLARNLAKYPKNKDTADLAGKTAIFDTFPLNDTTGRVTPAACDPTKVVTTADAFKGGAYVPHVAEGIAVEANNEFQCLSQSSVGVITDRTAMIHSVGLSAKDVAATAKANAMIVWSPRSNIDYYGDTAPITVFKAAGVKIGIGTDWLPSGSINLLRELQCADALNQKYFAKALSDRELFDIATKNGASAGGYDKEIGSLAVGFAADLAVFDARVSKGFRAVIDAGVEDVRLVLRAGKPLVGDAELVDALGGTCDALELCGVARKVCLDVAGVTLAGIRTALTTNYPLYFCKGKAPTNEPSCTPWRDTYPAGTSATDRDGDGIEDGKDDCPDVFNPPRPLDIGKQSDVDADGFGDACDAKPLDPAAH
ncbi:MAG: amidohydrolase family protein [Deltaproteobacteria bacterium]|nr:amidohydrolase family protein [Deltaproteobacteria bacterium]